MTDNLEKVLGYDYNLSDYFILFKGTRHLKMILKIDDPIVRYYETAVNAIITGTQIAGYYGLYKLLTI
jgi:hypothetical protein